MSELQIDPDIGADLECEVGDELSVTIKGTVKSKTPEGGKTLDVTEVTDYKHAEAESEDRYSHSEDDGDGMKRKGPSAVMVMIGKGK